MNPEKDFYAVLGILPDAEAVVVVAAYRALASLYHPDKWKGDVTEATRRMAEINVAYGVLGDAAKRKAYDASRKAGHSSFDARDDEKDAAFDDALSGHEERWKVAIEIFPDLTDIRKRLAKTAHRLAFAFVTVMLETKRFSQRIQVSEAMESSFLQQYFGTNPEIISFVKRLVVDGKRDAVKAVNRYVEVLGSDVPAWTIIKRVESDFELNTVVTAARNDFKSALNSGDNNRATLAGFQLIKEFGYTYRTNFSGIRIMDGDFTEVAFFKSEVQFIDWLIEKQF